MAPIFSWISIASSVFTSIAFIWASQTSLRWMRKSLSNQIKLVEALRARDALLSLAHGQGAPHDLLGQLLLVVGRSEGDQGPRVTGGEFAGPDFVAYWRR